MCYRRVFRGRITRMARTAVDELQQQIEGCGGAVCRWVCDSEASGSGIRVLPPRQNAGPAIARWSAHGRAGRKTSTGRAPNRGS